MSGNLNDLARQMRDHDVVCLCRSVDIRLALGTIDRLRGRVEQLKARVEELEGHVTCFYCGQTWPIDEVPEDHGEHCPESPTNELRAERDRLRAILQDCEGKART